MLSPAYTAPELVELAEAEALRVLHHHHRGVGHVHTHLYYGGGDQDIRLAGGEGGHDGVLLLGLHLAVDKGDAQVREDLLLEHGGVLLDGLAVVGECVVFLYHGADDIGLPAGGDVLMEEGVDPLAVAAGDGEGVHRLPAGGELVDDGGVQVAVDDQGQGPGDGGGGHHQEVGVRALGREGRTLGHAEAVLLIGDHQA